MPHIDIWYLIQYDCPCGEHWQEEWSCACDSECGACGTAVAATSFTEHQLQGA